MLCDYLSAKGNKVEVMREPGGTPIGEDVRRILLNGYEEQGVTMNPWTELFLYEACRAQLVADVIRPAMDAEKIVLCDRFYDSTVAYQAGARGINAEAVDSLNILATQGLKPDLTILVDCPVEVGLSRAFARIERDADKDKDGKTGREDRFELEGTAFHERVRRGYLQIAENEPERVKVVDGTGSEQEVHRDVCKVIDGLFEK